MTLNKILNELQQTVFYTWKKHTDYPINKLKVHLTFLKLIYFNDNMVKVQSTK